VSLLTVRVGRDDSPVSAVVEGVLLRAFDGLQRCAFDDAFVTRGDDRRVSVCTHCGVTPGLMARAWSGSRVGLLGVVPPRLISLLALMNAA